MKRTTRDGQQIGLIKKGCVILAVSLDATGNPTATIDQDPYDTEAECGRAYDALPYPEVADLGPVGPWPVQTRGEASQLNQSKYYTGRNCKYGHISQRYVASGLCIACISAKSKGFKRNRDAAKAGLVPVNLMVHPEDAQTVRSYAETVAQARTLL